MDPTPVVVACLVTDLMEEDVVEAEAPGVGVVVDAFVVVVKFDFIS